MSDLLLDPCFLNGGEITLEPEELSDLEVVVAVDESGNLCRAERNEGFAVEVVGCEDDLEQSFIVTEAVDVPGEELSGELGQIHASEGFVDLDRLVPFRDMLAELDDLKQGRLLVHLAGKFFFFFFSFAHNPLNEAAVFHNSICDFRFLTVLSHKGELCAILDFCHKI